MDLLKTILIYMSMVFVSSAQNAPEPTLAPPTTPAPTAWETTAEPRVTATAATQTPTPTSVPTPNITPNNAYKTIRVGDNGEEVAQMQRRLAELGYYEGDIDGRFGNQTRRAVERFQYNNGLSADGIAGKRTLTVLFESADVVVFTEADETPAPPAATPKQQPTAALVTVQADATPAPTFVPTQAPSAATVATVSASADTEKTSENGDAENELSVPTEATVAPSAESTLSASVQPTVEPDLEPETEQEDALIPLSDVHFVLDGQSEPLAKRSQEQDAEPVPLMPVVKDETVVMIPLLSILESANVAIVPSITEGHVEYAFAILEDFYHFSYDLDEHGTPGGLVINKNREPQLMTDRSVALYEGLVYLPLEDVEKWTGLTFVFDEEDQLLTVVFPTVDNGEKTGGFVGKSLTEKDSRL